MERFSLLLISILLVLEAFCIDVFDGACDVTNLTAVEIIGGKTTVLENGTKLHYTCPEGQYPYPVEDRLCEYGRRWEVMKNAAKRIIPKATCRVRHCSRVLEFENGNYEPRQLYYNVSQQITFTCYSGYNIKGPEVRTCLPNGKWSGGITICDDGSGHCPNPGIPIGGRKEGKQYRISYRVRYSCGNELTLVGSKDRICQESGTWSGSEPECQQPFSFDTPEEVASKFISSLTETAETASSEKNISTLQKRRIVIEEGGSMNIYFVLDASKSINKQNFTQAKDAIIKLIEKIANYGVFPNYGLITFATQSKEIVSTTHPQSADADWVTELLEKVEYVDHRQKPGTNIRNGLQAVYEMMISQEAEERRKGLKPPPISNSTRHVIILLSDGLYNMGGDPVPVIHKIREFLKIGYYRFNRREDFLDVYVFGVGSLINMVTLNDLASKKDGETHVFKLKEYQDVQEAFEKIIDDTQTLSMCGLAKEKTKAEDQLKNPWHTTITIRRTSGTGFQHCKGTLVSAYYILTAAHCFNIDDTADQIKITIGTEVFSVAAVYTHPQYNIGKLRDRGIPEFYDYDVALVELSTKVEPSFRARPICLPCTKGTSRALRKPIEETTCKDQENLLLPVGSLRSFYVTDCKSDLTGSRGLLRKIVQIKNNEKKLACDQDAKHAQYYKNVTEIDEIVTERFLCTGGQEPELDPNTCKGDSGGPLIIKKSLRYIQVGVISWGVVDACKGKYSPKCEKPNEHPPDTPSYARDYHINLFKVLPWLKERLADEGLEFL